MSIGSVLARRRKELGMKQTELAAALADYGIEVSHHAVTRWETDKVIPNARQFLALCRVLGIRDVLGEFCGEGGLLDGLNRRGRERAQGVHPPAPRQRGLCRAAGGPGGGAGSPAAAVRSGGLRRDGAVSGRGEL